MNERFQDVFESEIEDTIELTELQESVAELCEQNQDKFPSLPFVWHEGKQVATFRCLPICIDEIEVHTPIEELSFEERVIYAVAEQFSIKERDVVSSTQTAHIVEAREWASYILREQTEMSYPKIGKLLEKDHSTIVSAVQRMRKKIDAEEFPAEAFTDTLEWIQSTDAPVQTTAIAEGVVFLSPNGSLHAAGFAPIEPLRAEWLGMKGVERAVDLDTEVTDEDLWTNYGRIAHDRIQALDHGSKNIDVYRLTES